jgi:hypothetical protein
MKTIPFRNWARDKNGNIACHSLVSVGTATIHKGVSAVLRLEYMGNGDRGTLDAVQIGLTFEQMIGMVEMLQDTLLRMSEQLQDADQRSVRN